MPVAKNGQAAFIAIEAVQQTQTVSTASSMDFYRRNAGKENMTSVSQGRSEKTSLQ
jgi:hypothetical protein